VFACVREKRARKRAMQFWYFGVWGLCVGCVYVSGSGVCVSVTSGCVSGVCVSGVLFDV